eukprot:3276436-Alexandrium_andersonii.AAC.1
MLPTLLVDQDLFSITSEGFDQIVPAAVVESPGAELPVRPLAVIERGRLRSALAQRVALAGRKPPYLGAIAPEGAW